MSFPNHYSLVKEHDKHYELHDSRDNKTFSVAKKDLHPAHQIKLLKMKKFAEGGEVPVGMPDPQKAKDAWRGAQTGEMERLKSLLGFGDSQDKKQVKKYADGGEIVPDYLNTPVQDLNLPADPDPFLTRAGNLLGGAVSRGVEGALGGFPPVIEKVSNAASQFGQGLSKGFGVEPAAQAPVATPQPQVSARTPSAEEAQAPKAETPPLPPALQGAMAQGLVTPQDLQAYQAQYATGLRKEADALKEQNDQLADLHQTHAWAMENSAKQYNETMTDLQNQAQGLMQDIASSKVDPNRYWNSKSTGSKVTSILGVVLGGIGAGLQHSTTNMGWEALQGAINKDIDAQKLDLGKKQTLLGDNLRIQGNMRDAEAATRLQMNSIVQGQMAKIAASTNNPIMQAQVDQKIAQLKMSQIPLQQQLAMSQAEMAKRQAMMQALQGKDISKVDPAQLVPMLVPEPQRKEVFSEVKRAQDTRKGMGAALQAFDDMVKELKSVKSAGGLIDPEAKTRLESAILPTVQDVEGSVRQTAMDYAKKAYVPSMSDILAGRIDGKRAALEQYFKSKSSAPTAKAYGIDLDKFESTKPTDFGPTTERITSDGKVALFDSRTKKFLGYK